MAADSDAISNYLYFHSDRNHIYSNRDIFSEYVRQCKYSSPNHFLLFSVIIKYQNCFYSADTTFLILHVINYQVLHDHGLSNHQPYRRKNVTEIVINVRFQFVGGENVREAHPVVVAKRRFVVRTKKRAVKALGQRMLTKACRPVWSGSAGRQKPSTE